MNKQISEYMDNSNMCEWVNECINEWMSVNEWVNKEHIKGNDVDEWTSESWVEQINEWMSEDMNREGVNEWEWRGKW